MTQPYSEDEIAAFFTAYVEAALWSSSFTSDDDIVYESIRDDWPQAQEADDYLELLTDRARERMESDCRAFIEANLADLRAIEDVGQYGARSAEWSAPELAGHDFWLTRNGHGVGFWDRGLGEVGERLTKAAQAYRESTVEVTDDDKVDVL